MQTTRILKLRTSRFSSLKLTRKSNLDWFQGLSDPNRLSFFKASRVLVGIRCGTAPRQYVHVNVQTDDTALRGLPPDLRKDAKGSCRRRNWKEDLDRMLNNIQFDLWRKGWARDITM